MTLLKRLDQFAKVPAEFTESTVHGGILTFCAIATMIILFFLELSAFLSTKTMSTVLLDSNFAQTVKIEFDITMLDLPCQYATVNMVDELGFRKVNVTTNIQKQIYHWRRDQLIPGDVHFDKNVDVEDGMEEIDRNLELDDEGHHALAIKTEKEFNEDLRKHHLSFVNFYAPWCHWCQRLKPHWESAAAKFDDIKFRHRNLNVKFMSVDCDKFTELCSKYKVRAFPSLLRFKRSDPVPPFYDDQRNEDSLIAFFRRTVEDYEKHMPNLFKFEACRMQGWVEVSRVPGNLYIEGANPPGQNLSPSMTNVSHVVNYFQFGGRGSALLRNIIPRDHLRLMRPLDGRTFLATEMHTAPHHYLKVVTTTFNSIPSLFSNTFYEMTTQNRIASYDEDETPCAKFSYDLSPLAITVGQKATKWYDFITSVLGIIGGTWTVIRLFDNVLFWSKEKVKSAIGKKD